jgi:putative addiction module antidote
MNMIAKLTKVGNSTGIILPKDVLRQLGAEVGDFVSIGSIELKPHRPDFEAQMAVAREVMERRKLALRELAK